MRGIPMFVMAGMVLAACGRDGREPGDDPARANEGPTAGRPATDPNENVQPSDASGVSQSDQVSSAPADTRGSEDGPSEKTLAPDRPR